MTNEEPNRRHSSREGIPEPSLSDFRRFFHRTFSLTPRPDIPPDVLQVIGPELCFSGQPRSSRESWYQTARVWALLHALPPNRRCLVLSRQTGWPGLPMAMRGRSVVIPGFPLSALGNSLTRYLDIGNLQSATGQSLEAFHPGTFFSVAVSRQFLAHMGGSTVFPHLSRLLVPDGMLAIIDEGPVETEFRCHLVLSDPHRNSLTLLFVFGFPREKRREYFVLRITGISSLHLPDLPARTESSGKSVKSTKSPFHPWKAFLTNLPGEVNQVEHWEDLGTFDPGPDKFKHIQGFGEIRSFPDPAFLCRDFLHQQALHFSDHPFLSPVVFENICSGLGHLAVRTALLPGTANAFWLVGKENFCHATSSVA
jgi:hypothetical protein